MLIAEFKVIKKDLLQNETVKLIFEFWNRGNGAVMLCDASSVVFSGIEEQSLNCHAGVRHPSSHWWM